MIVRSFVILLALGSAFAQTPAAPQPAAPAGPLNGQQAAETIGRCLQLMESTATVLPSLKGSSVSLIADARSVMEDLQRLPGNASFTYHFLNDVQAYLQLADVLPRPADLPQEGQRQLNELHDDFGRLETYFRPAIDLEGSAASQSRPRQRAALRRRQPEPAEPDGSRAWCSSATPSPISGG